LSWQQWRMDTEWAAVMHGNRVGNNVAYKLSGRQSRKETAWHSGKRSISVSVHPLREVVHLSEWDWWIDPSWSVLFCLYLHCFAERVNPIVHIPERKICCQSALWNISVFNGTSYTCLIAYMHGRPDISEVYYSCEDQCHTLRNLGTYLQSLMRNSVKTAMG